MSDNIFGITENGMVNLLIFYDEALEMLRNLGLLEEYVDRLGMRGDTKKMFLKIIKKRVAQKIEKKEVLDGEKSAE